MKRIIAELETFLLKPSTYFRSRTERTLNGLREMSVYIYFFSYLISSAFNINKKVNNRIEHFTYNLEILQSLKMQLLNLIFGEMLYTYIHHSRHTYVIDIFLRFEIFRYNI